MKFNIRPESLSCWVKTLSLGILLLLRGNLVVAQNMDTFNVGSGVPGDNSSQPLVNYTTPISATNFFNDTGSTFSYNLVSGAPSWIDNLYEGWRYTRNFTNYGEMDSITGFRFDKQISSHTEASSFYNVGNINCGTLASAAFLRQYYYLGYYYGGYGGIYVWATNIYNSGTIAVGYDGLARFVGDNLDFTYGNISVNNTGGANSFIYATGQADIYTNNWNPANALTDTSATGLMQNSPNQLSLSNPGVYTSAQGRTTRYILVQDSSGANVSYNVYFNNGTGYVEWVGTYVDPVSGQTVTSYQYLADNFAQGAGTNILSYGDPGASVPNNYTFTSATTPMSLGVPASSSSVNGVFTGVGSFTGNTYSYVNAQLVTTTVSTNGTGLGNKSASIAITNLPGRIEITANKNLTLTNAVISSVNYLLLKCTNEFDYDGSALINPAYSDIYLGRTNGNLVVTNLIPSIIPVWSGTVQAWNTVFYSYVTNPVTSVVITNTHEVLLVSSQLSPTSSPQVQDFVLNSPNNVVISDVLNISRNLSINCTNLMLTYNGAGNGASSADGELNLNAASISWANSLPRLRCLTNFGVISTVNPVSATFGAAALPYLSLYNANNIYNSGGMIIRALDLENYGILDAGAGSFVAQSLITTMSNAEVSATSGTFSDTATNLVISGTYIYAGKSFTLVATNLLTDTGPGNGNFWLLGGNYSGYSAWTGLVLPVKPIYGDLLGSRINITAVSGIKFVNNTWAALDQGCSVNGYTNNVAIGVLELDSQGAAGKFYFTGTSVSNAMYVDKLELWNYAGTNYSVGTNLTALAFNTNLVIYYAEAIDITSGNSVAEAINHWNGNHLRWVPYYAGYYSSINLGGTNVVNSALAQSAKIDSNANGTPNNADSGPFFVASEINLKTTPTIFNLTTSIQLQWTTIPFATNSIYYSTDSISWLPLTNFDNYYYTDSANNTNAVANSSSLNWFVSPQSSPGPTTNVWIYDPVTTPTRYYRVAVQPWLTYPY